MGPFTDLARLLQPLQSKDGPGRLKEIERYGQKTSVVAIGGFPITSDDTGLLWLGLPVSEERVVTSIRRALGFSGMLTFMNKSDLNYDQLGELCWKRGHDWAFHWVTISVLFIGYGLKAEMAFTRDTRFWMSWSVEGEGQIFVATAAFKEWRRFLRHAESPDWDAPSRLAMKDARSSLSFVL